METKSGQLSRRLPNPTFDFLQPFNSRVPEKQIVPEKKPVSVLYLLLLKKRKEKANFPS